MVSPLSWGVPFTTSLTESRCCCSVDPDPHGHTGSMERTGYAERRPYAVPQSLSDLVGPASGTIALPAQLGWTGRTVYDLDDDTDRAVFYERVLVDAATVSDVVTLVDAGLLRSVWRRLFLPAPVRRLWEQRFTDLVAAA